MIMPGLPYTREQLAFLHVGYKKNPAEELTALFNEKFGQARTLAAIKGTLKRNSFKSGRTGRFRKGEQAWNKGVKGYMGANKTSFKGGNTPHNTKPLYSERTGKNGYIEISVPETNPHTGHPSRYVQKHVWIWKQKNGPVPDGHVVTFRDGDITNLTIENLTLLSRAELLWLNRNEYAKYEDPQLRAIMRATARVVCSAHKKKKEIK